MTNSGALVALSILLGWAFFTLSALLLPIWLALVLAVGVAAMGASVLRTSLPIKALMALLAPFGIMLPALALRDIGTTLGVPIPGFTALEILVFLVLYTGFLAAAFGKLPFDLYRYGYGPKPVACMVLVLCAYSLLTGNWFLAAVAVLAQGVWTAGWGSSNWFDHMLHVLLWPVALVVLISGLF